MNGNASGYALRFRVIKAVADSSESILVQHRVALRKLSKTHYPKDSGKQLKETNRK